MSSLITSRFSVRKKNIAKLLSVRNKDVGTIKIKDNKIKTISEITEYLDSKYPFGVAYLPK